MLNNNKIEYRCATTVAKKSGGQTRCSAFLFEFSPGRDILKMRCRKCGTLYVVTTDSLGRLSIASFPKSKPLMTESTTKK